MDPIHLRPLEVDYELTIRGIVGLTTSRTKTLALRNALRRERSGLETVPRYSTLYFDADEEIQQCGAILGSIRRSLEEGGSSSFLIRTETATRISHVRERLNRIEISTLEQKETIARLLVLSQQLREWSETPPPAYDQLSRRGSPAVVAPSTQIDSTNDIVPSAQPTVSVPTMPLSWQSALTNLGRDEARRDLVRHVARTPLDPKAPSFNPQTDLEYILQNPKPVRSSRSLADRLVPTSGSGFQSRSTESSQHLSGNTISRIESALRSPSNPSSQNGEDSLHRTATNLRNFTSNVWDNHEITESVPRPTITNDHSIPYEPLRNRPFGNVEQFSEPNPSIVQRTAAADQYDANYIRIPYREFTRPDRDNTVFAERYSAPNPIDAHEPHINRVERFINPLVEESAAINRTSIRRADPSRSQRYVAPIAEMFSVPNNANGRAHDFARTEHTHEPLVSRYPTSSYPQARVDNHYRSVPLDRTFTFDNVDNNQNDNRFYRSNIAQVRDTAPRREDRYEQPSLGRYANEDVYLRNPYPQGERNFESNAFNRQGDSVNGYRRDPADQLRHHDYQPINFRDYREPNQGNNVYTSQQPTFRNHVRKTVPINQWRINFSGDGQGLHLYDFLSQVAMLQRAEQVSDEELLYSVVHLLSGRAKQWYGSVYGTFNSWRDLVDAFKYEFLPTNYEYSLLDDISNRKQKSTESFGEYLTHMQSLFRCVSLPIPEQHKLYIVQKNLSPRYSLCVAPIEIRSLKQLAEVCRRVDSANTTNRTAIGLPFEQQSQNSGSRWRNNYRSNQVHEIENEQISAEDCENELCAVRHQRRQNPSTVEKKSDRENNCYNCKKSGHAFRTCPEPRKGVFCYICGGQDVTSKTCNRCCLGNEEGNLAKGKDQQGSAAAESK